MFLPLTAPPIPRDALCHRAHGDGAVFGGNEGTRRSSGDVILIVLDGNQSQGHTSEQHLN